MRRLFVIVLFFLLACSKEEGMIVPNDVVLPPSYEKFVGIYKVYDTLGVYQYDMSIQYSTTIEGNFDSLTIFNFADTFDVSFQYIPPPGSKYISIGFHDSIVDYNNKTWGLWYIWDDTTTSIKENTLFNDTIIFYYDLDNIKYYIQEAQPYYQCNCKAVAVKQ